MNSNNINTNNNVNNKNNTQFKELFTPRNLTILFTICSLVIIVLSIISTQIAWSYFPDHYYYYYDDSYEDYIIYYYDAPIYPQEYLKALIGLSIIFIFSYCAALISYINGKFPNKINPKYILAFVIISCLFQIASIICAFCDKDDLNASLALGYYYKKLHQGTIIYIIATALHVLLLFASFYYFISIVPEPKKPSHQMNSANQQFNPQFSQQFNNILNSEEIQYIQQLEQYIQQLYQSNNPSQMSTTLQQTIDQLSSYIGQLRNFQSCMNNSLKNMDTSIQNNTNILSSLSINNQHYLTNNNQQYTP